MRASRIGVMGNGGQGRTRGLRGRLAPALAVALVPGLLFSALTLGLRVPSIARSDGSGPGGVDYSRITSAVAPLRAPYIEGVLGSLVGGPPRAPAATAPSSVEEMLARAATVVAHPLTNDAFASAYRVPSVPFTARSDTAGATREPDEPAGCAPVGGRTVWYRYEAPIDLGLIADTFGTDHAVSLGVFTGSELGDLEQVGACSTSGSGNAYVPFPAARGTTYFFQVSSVSGGALIFDLRFQGQTVRFDPGDRFALATGGPTGDPRYWAFMGVEKGTAPTHGCVGMIGFFPPAPGVCRIQTYVLDSRTGDVTLVSRSSEGEVADDTSIGLAVSRGGRYVVIASIATNLLPGGRDSNTCWIYVHPGQCPDVFVHDRDADGNGIFDETFRGAIRTTRISVPTHRSGEGNSWSWLGSLSTDGRFVGFQSDASNLVPGDTNGVGDAFMHDRDADGNGIFDETFPGARRTFRVSVGDGGIQPEDVPSRTTDHEAALDERDAFWAERGSHFLGMSTNGRFAMFRSPSPGLVPGDTNGVYDVFVRDVQAGTTTRVNVSSDGAQADRGTRLHNGFPGPVSDDGRFAVFISDATNLVEGDTNDTEDLFVRDLETGTTTRVSIDWLGRQTVDEPTAPDSVLHTTANHGSLVTFEGEIIILSPMVHGITADGRFVYFTTNAALVPEDDNGVRDAYVRDLKRGTVALLSVSTAGVRGDGSTNGVMASADGRSFSFASSATNLDDAAPSGNAAIPIVLSTFVRSLPRAPR